jgi:protein phosphatase
MGSRAVVVVCKDEDVARRRFGIVGEGEGVCYTRTGRRFFEDRAVERAVLDSVRRAMDGSGLWDRLETDWVCLDCELMPWSAKALELLRQQYASVGAAARAATPEAVAALQAAASRHLVVGELLHRYETRRDLAASFVEAYRRYCWSVESPQDLKLAPFHVMATEGVVHLDKDHVWHMGTLTSLAKASDGLLVSTDHRLVDLTDPLSEAEATAWWQDYTDRGGEGMVVKPLSFVAKGRKGLVQPAMKVRGREYLRLIYGAEYTLPENLDRLHQRSVGAKRSLALREFALGIEGLERFVRGEPLRRVHECAFGVLALESEPVDPRL